MGKRASSSDVAVLAGVSRTTVSFVLNNAPGKNIPEETRRKVLSAAKTLGYIPNQNARSIAMLKHHTVGFFIPHAGYISCDAYILRVIEGMTPVFNKNRSQLVLQPLKLNQVNYIQLAQQDNVDGIILMNTHDGDKGLADLIEAGFPLVVIGSIASRRVCQIDIDNRAAAAEAISHLAGLGHRDIGVIVHAPRSYYAAEERLRGFRDALKTAGIPLRKEWMREANFTEASGYKAMKEILSLKKRPTAVFAGNDVVAYGVIQAIKDAGLSIPGDISIVGFDDDIPSRYVNPPLTTVTNPAAGLGAEAARMMISLLKGEKGAPGVTLLPTRLSVRASSAAPAPPSAASRAHPAAP